MTEENLRKELFMAARFLRGFENRAEGQENILKIIADNEGISQMGLQMFLRVSPATVSEMMTKLENKGMIERKRDQMDHRSIRISLTEKGLAKVNEMKARQEENAFDCLTEQQKEQLYEILVTLNNDLLRKVPMERRHRHGEGHHGEGHCEKGRHRGECHQPGMERRHMPFEEGKPHHVPFRREIMDGRHHFPGNDEPEKI